MVKPTPDPPIVPLPPDHPLFHYPGVFERVEGDTLAARFAQQRADLAAVRRNAQMPTPPPRHEWQSGAEAETPTAQPVRPPVLESDQKESDHG